MKSETPSRRTTGTRVAYDESCQLPAARFLRGKPEAGNWKLYRVPLTRPEISFKSPRNACIGRSAVRSAELVSGVSVP